MTNPNPISPSTIMTENAVLERLDIIQDQFAHSSNDVQARLDEQKLIHDFIRALTIPGGVREPKKCAEALVESTHFINI